MQNAKGKMQNAAPHFAFCILHSLVRWAFARFYREFAWTYDAVAFLVSRGYWRHWTLTALPYTRGRALELGCGTGNLQLALAQGGWQHLGLDASPQMLALTRRRLRAAGVPAPLLRGTAQALPLAPASFDTVIATFPTEYIVHSATLAEVRRVLAPGGRLLIVDAAQFTGAGSYEFLVDLAYRLTLQGSTRFSETLPDPRLPYLAHAGFTCQGHWEAVGRSRVMVLVASSQ
jgi:ubiquinone/menaquinone biosynthesis C-methylase UbiE